MVEVKLLEKHTHKNALCAYEVESVMECGDYGGLQRWQLTIIHLSFGERKLYFYKSHRPILFFSKSLEFQFYTKIYLLLVEILMFVRIQP